MKPDPVWDFVILPLILALAVYTVVRAVYSWPVIPSARATPDRIPDETLDPSRNDAGP